MLLSDCEETVIKEYNYLSIILTNKKVTHKGNKNSNYILLKDIKSCRVRRGRNKLLIMLAITGFVIMEFCIFLEMINLALFLCFTSVACAVGYFFSFRNVVVIASENKKIVVNVKNVRENKVRGFINSIEQTRNNILSQDRNDD